MRELCEGPGGAFVQPFNVTPSEQELSERLGLPLYGPPAALAGLGSKTGSRRVARLAGVAVLDGAEDLRSVEAVEAAARRLRRPAAPPVGAVVIKLNDGFSGQGNAVVDLAGLNGSLLDSPVVFCAEEESWPSFAAKIVEGGAVVEELLDVPGMVSPSVQLRILPGGTPLVLSTHSQVLGGPNRQVYLGCRFPADPRPTAARSRPRPSGWAGSWPPAGSSATSGSTSSSSPSAAGSGSSCPRSTSGSAAPPTRSAWPRWSPTAATTPPAATWSPAAGPSRTWPPTTSSRRRWSAASPRR